MQSNTIINSELPNALKVYNFLSENHFDSRSICGMLGNFTRESHMDLLENEIGGGGGYGLAQWTPQETNYWVFFQFAALLHTFWHIKLERAFL